MSTVTTGNKVFAPVIFFIAAREALEASLVIGILTGMLEQLVNHTDDSPDATLFEGSEEERKLQTAEKRALIKRLRKIVLLGAFAGLFVAFCIGAAFLAVFYTQVNDLFAKAEELWEGIFNLIAVVLITPMALAILRANQSKAKWRNKLANAFQKKAQADQPIVARNEKDVEAVQASSSGSEDGDITVLPQLDAQGSPSSPVTENKKDEPLPAPIPQPLPRGRFSRFGLGFDRGTLALFSIPFVTTLREGLEGVVFIGGVSLSLPASSIPLPAIIGLLVGLAIGFAIFKSGNVMGVRIFLLFSTGFLLLIAAGMASRAVYFLQFHAYVQLVGDGAAESGDGPASYNAKGYVWHLNCCNPETKDSSGQGWGVLNSLVGWNNTATYGSIFMYVGYWIVVSGYLWYCIWKEGRLRFSWKGKTLWESGRAKRARLAKQ